MKIESPLIDSHLNELLIFISIIEKKWHSRELKKKKKIPLTIFIFIFVSSISSMKSSEKTCATFENLSD